MQRLSECSSVIIFLFSRHFQMLSPFSDLVTIFWFCHDFLILSTFYHSVTIFRFCHHFPLLSQVFWFCHHFQILSVCFDFVNIFRFCHHFLVLSLLNFFFSLSARVFCRLRWEEGEPSRCILHLCHLLWLSSCRWSRLEYCFLFYGVYFDFLRISVFTFFGHWDHLRTLATLFNQNY